MRLTKLPDKSGIMTTAHGLRIACLGGIYNPGIYTTAEAPPVRACANSFEVNAEHHILGVRIPLLLHPHR